MIDVINNLSDRAIYYILCASTTSTLFSITYLFISLKKAKYEKEREENE